MSFGLPISIQGKYTTNVVLLQAFFAAFSVFLRVAITAYVLTQ